MRIELGAHVWTHEGKEAGKVNQLIVDPSQQTLDSFVVHTQWMGQDLIVPIHDVEQVDADDTIHLSITDEQFRELPPYVVSEYVSGGASQGTVYSYGGGMHEVNLSGGGGYSQRMDYDSGPLIGMPAIGSNVVSTESSLSENEYAITKGTKVMSADGQHIGNVHELSVTDEGKVQGVVVVSGHIRKHLQLVPVAQVESADFDTVFLRLSTEEFHELEQTGQGENERP